MRQKLDPDAEEIGSVYLNDEDEAANLGVDYQ